MIGVYAFTVAGQLKVGRSINVEQRLRTHDLDTPAKMRVIGVARCRSWEGSIRLERRIHVKLRKWRIRGEWHLVTRESLAIVKSFVVRIAARTWRHWSWEPRPDSEDSRAATLAAWRRAAMDHRAYLRERGLA